MDAGVRDEFNALKAGREAKGTTTLDMIAHAEKPFLVWKTDEQVGEPPQKLADVKDRVAEAWKMMEARDRKALPYAQKIAEGLLKGNAQYRTALSFAGKDVGAKLIELPHDREAGADAAQSLRRRRLQAVPASRADQVSARGHRAGPDRSQRPQGADQDRRRRHRQRQRRACSRRRRRRTAVRTCTSRS